MDLNKIENTLFRCKTGLNEMEKTINETIQDISEKDESQMSYDLFYSTLSKGQKEYHRANTAYKQYISQYSREYIEMSEWYYGPELPYEVYLKEFKKPRSIRMGDTYLDSPEDVKEMYKLFIFFMMYQYFITKPH